MNKHLKYFPAVLGSSLIVPAVGHAIGLGKLTINSFLNQNLNAQIRLLTDNKMALSDVNVGLASEDEFKQVGIPMNSVLHHLKFRIVKNNRGQSIIDVTSDKRIDEPYLKFLLDVSSPSGKFFRSYTILLDPPNYYYAKQVKSLPPGITPDGGIVPGEYYYDAPPSNGNPAIPYRQNLPMVKAKPYSTTAAATAHTSSGDKIAGYYGPIHENDNLWAIAHKVRPSKKVTIDQAMLAIVGENPQAFIGGDINRLKVGTKLRLPDEQAIASIPANAALHEVLAQNKAWQQHHPIHHVLYPPYIKQFASAPVPSKPQLRVAHPLLQAKQSIDQNGLHLQLETANPGDIEKSNLLLAGSNSNQQPAELQAELAITAAAVKTARHTNQILEQQLNNISTQNQQLQQQINQRNNAITNLRLNLLDLKNRWERFAAGGTSGNISSAVNHAIQPSAILSDYEHPGFASDVAEPLPNDAGGSISKLLWMLVILSSGIAVASSWMLFNVRRKNAGNNGNEARYSEADLEAIIEQKLREAAAAESRPQPAKAEPVATVSATTTNSIEITNHRSDNVPNNSSDDGSELSTPISKDSMPRSAPADTAAETVADQDNKAADHVIEFEDGLGEGLSLAKRDTSSEASPQEPKTETDSLTEFAGEDVAATKLDMAVAYISMEDNQAAISLLEEVLLEGSQQQQQEAKDLLNQIKD